MRQHLSRARLAAPIAMQCVALLGRMIMIFTSLRLGLRRGLRGGALASEVDGAAVANTASCGDCSPRPERFDRVGPDLRPARRSCFRRRTLWRCWSALIASGQLHRMRVQCARNREPLRSPQDPAQAPAAASSRMVSRFWREGPQPCLRNPSINVVAMLGRPGELESSSLFLER